ncbi:MAG TPA: hypothetical protein VHL31_23450 [Geminicoccus sp.]|jgi:hypothetical protein|uniref:hypothetical protein n=1 Tax=Geminicoccus sp. TaxID=2024832 RepID=UPI002E3631EC|nr:hypothetical protein [Geminicoccus sp.]HEX2529241.1 hypothetical protein [Geminicoccus sp.]
MTEDDKKPVIGSLTGALNSDPHENARRAEETLDAPRRREQEEAMRNKEDATSQEESSTLHDIGATRPAD